MYYSSDQASESLYNSLRQQALDAILAYENSATGIEDAFITGFQQPFTSYPNRTSARVHQAVLAVNRADAAAAVQDWQTACIRASEAAEAMNVDVAALPSADQEVANQAKAEAGYVIAGVSNIGNTASATLLTIVQYTTAAVIIVGSIWLVAKLK